MKGETPLAYLAIYPWDVERWRNSDAAEELSLAGQAAYINLCFRAWQEQPHCRLPNDDDKLWRKAGARSKSEWMRVRNEVLARWEVSPDGQWISHPVVLATYADSYAAHLRAVERGRTAGRASARARRNSNKFNNGDQHKLNVSSTQVNPPSPSPSPSPEEENARARGVPDSGASPAGPSSAPSSTSPDPPDPPPPPNGSARSDRAANVLPAAGSQDLALVALSYFADAYKRAVGFDPADGVLAEAERTLWEIGVDAKRLNRMRNLGQFAVDDEFVAEKLKSPRSGLRWVLVTCRGENADRFDAEAAPKHWEMFGSPEGWLDHKHQEDKARHDVDAEYERRMSPVRPAIEAAILEHAAVDGPTDAEIILASAPTFSNDEQIQDDAARRFAAMVAHARALRRHQQGRAVVLPFAPIPAHVDVDIDRDFGPAPKTPRRRIRATRAPGRSQ